MPAPQPMPDFDFLAQEPLHLGHHSQEPQITSQMVTYNQMQERRHASLNARRQRQAQQQSTQSSGNIPGSLQSAHPSSGNHAGPLQPPHLSSTQQPFDMYNININTPAQDMLPFNAADLDTTALDFGEEEQLEMQDDPHAADDEDSVAEYEKRLNADQELLESFTSQTSQITSTAVTLPAPRIPRNASHLAGPNPLPSTPLRDRQPASGGRQPL
ncbi:hypothetical protein DXG01_009880, partial [Tephrocybe rancida]